MYSQFVIIIEARTEIIVFRFQLIMNRLLIFLLFAVAIAMLAIPNEGIP